MDKYTYIDERARKPRALNMTAEVKEKVKEAILQHLIDVQGSNLATAAIALNYSYPVFWKLKKDDKEFSDQIEEIMLAADDHLVDTAKRALYNNLLENKERSVELVLRSKGGFTERTMVINNNLMDDDAYGDLEEFKKSVLEEHEQTGP